MKNRCLLLDFAGTIAHTKLSFEELLESFHKMIAKELNLDIEKVKEAENNLSELGNDLFSPQARVKISSIEKEYKIHEKWYSSILQQLKIENNKLVIKLIDYRMNGIEYILYNDTFEALKNLYEKFNIITLTNGLPSRINEINNLGIKKYLNNIYISSIIGYEKPSKEAFTIVLEKNQLDSKKVVFVDDKDKNLKAAKELGFRVIQMNRGTVSNTSTEFEQISSLMELQKVL